MQCPVCKINFKEKYQDRHEESRTETITDDKGNNIKRVETVTYLKCPNEKCRERIVLDRTSRVAE